MVSREATLSGIQLVFDGVGCFLPRWVTLARVKVVDGFKLMVLSLATLCLGVGCGDSDGI